MVDVAEFVSERVPSPVAGEIFSIEELGLSTEESEVHSKDDCLTGKLSSVTSEIGTVRSISCEQANGIINIIYI